MTKKNALEIAISALSTDPIDEEAVAVLKRMVEQLDARKPVSDEAKAKASAKRKEATAEARAKLVETVTPVLLKYLSKDTDVTVKELYDKATSELPAGFTAPKVQNILLREMKPMLIITETKGKANTYRLA